MWKSTASPVIDGFFGAHVLSLLNDRAVLEPQFAPSAVEALAVAGIGAEGKLGGEFLVDLNAPARPLINIGVAVLQHRAALKNFLCLLIESSPLLDAEVVAGYIEREIDGVSHRRNVSRPMPCGSHAKLLGQHSDFARGSEAAGLRHVDAYVIDEPFRNQRLPFVRTVEQFAHRDWGGALLADVAEPGEIFRREGVLNEIRIVRLRLFAKLNGKRYGEALMYVVAESYLCAEFLAKCSEQFQGAGGHDIGLLLSSPLTKGLIHRAVEESGTVMIGCEPTPSRTRLEAAGIELAANLKALAKNQIQYLRSLSAAEILKGSPAYGQRGPLRPEPDIDGYAVVKLPAQVFREHRELPVPLMIGNNGRERTMAGGPEALKKALGDYYHDRGAEATKVYGLDGPNPDSYAPHGGANAQWETDRMFRCGSVVVANWHSARFPTWEYEFTRAPEPRGAVHSWELQFVFGNLKQATEPADRSLSDQVVGYWTNFATTGNPNGGSLPNWPKHDATAAAYMDFSADGPVAREGLVHSFRAGTAGIQMKAGGSPPGGRDGYGYRRGHGSHSAPTRSKPMPRVQFVACQFSLRVEASGFRTPEVKGIDLANSEIRDLGKLVLQLGPVSEHVTITAEAGTGGQQRARRAHRPQPVERSGREGTGPLRVYAPGRRRSVASRTAKSSDYTTRGISSTRRSRVRPCGRRPHSSK
jgi:hypothetical protein